MSNKNVTEVTKVSVPGTENEIEKLNAGVENASTEKEVSSEELKNSVVEVESDSEGSFTVSGEDLLNKEHIEVPKLLEPVLPKVGLAAMSGGSDTGKSSFLRQLVTSIVLGKTEFLGFTINAEYNSAIYVSTEDGEDAMAFLLNKQNISKEENQKFKELRFIFETDNLLAKLDKALKEKPVDCVIIDAFADLFAGDINATNKVRSNLNEYGLLAKKHKCLFIFLHHTGKGKEDLAPSKNNLLGSQGFEAKMRLVMELRKDNNDPVIRHLCFVKGNYLATEYKQSSYVMKFDENMLFTNLNKRVSFNDLRRFHERSSNDKILEVKIAELESQGITSVRKISESLKKVGIKAGKSRIALSKKKRPTVQNPINMDNGQPNTSSTID